MKKAYGEDKYRIHDPMNLKLFEIGEYKMGGWPFSHFYLHFILGMIAPQYWHIWITMGITWEVCEFYGGYNTKQIDDKNDELVYTKEFYGNNYDPATNTIGMICGMTVHRLLNQFEMVEL
jgi:hypothetical protein